MYPRWLFRFGFLALMAAALGRSERKTQNQPKANVRLAGDIPVPADYNGDKSTDIAVYRPSSNLRFVWSCTTNAAISPTLLGTAKDLPIAAALMP